MSGLVAAYGPFDPRMGERMLDRLAHRGPDGQGSVTVGDAWLGHRRLAIVDIEGGAQPLSDERRERWLIGDGEVYNHARLRARLDHHQFATGSDHETIVHLYEDEGLDALHELWGMFAFVIAGGEDRFVAVRDSLGIAPLYWARRDDTVLFASELKAYDDDWRPYVEPFPGGHHWTPDGGLVEWKSVPTRVPVLMRSLTPDDAPPEWVYDAVRDVVVRAIERSMVADVPVGAFLSGGLDSSIVTAVAARAARRDGWTLKTFAAGLPGSGDLAAARTVAEHVGTDHRERHYTPEEAIEWVPDVIRILESFDPMLVHSAVPNTMVAELASQHVKMVLIGEGADEVFAGYSHYRDFDTGEDLLDELLATIAGLHNLGLQRVDRVTSANGIEARIPFLDLDVVEFGLALPPDWKLITPERPEKWLLRRAFEGWLPDEVLWRPKEQFGQGTGADEVLRRHFGEAVTEADLEREREQTDPPLRTREELAYYRLFRSHLHGVEAEAIGRFVEP